MALWYVDTTAGGANNGTSKTDAWTNIRSAFEWAGYAAGDIIYVRRNQTHTMTNAHCIIGDVGTNGNPIRMIGDNDSLNIWADVGDVRPIFDWGAFFRYFYWNSKDFWELRNLEFRNSESYVIRLLSSSDVDFYNCIWTDTGQTPTYGVFMSGSGSSRFEDCAWSVAASIGALYVADAFARVRNCTFDGANRGIYCVGNVELENVTFGGVSQNTTDVYMYSGRLVGRNVSFNAVGSDIYFHPHAGILPYAAIEDYNGVKGAWHKECYYGDIDSFASAGTVAGQRAGGAITVIKVVAASNVSEYAPLLAHEEVRNDLTAGTKTFDVYIQPEGWAVVPDTQGSDADIWVEIAAWDSATGEYLYFDSRDEGSQDVQVNGAWNKITVNNVAVDLAGNVVIRVWQKTGDGADIVYVDGVIDSSTEPAFVLDQIVSSESAAVWPVPGDVEAGVTYGPTGTDYTGEFIGSAHVIRVEIPAPEIEVEIG